MKRMKRESYLIIKLTISGAILAVEETPIPFQTTTNLDGGGWSQTRPASMTVVVEKAVSGRQSTDAKIPQGLILIK